MVIFDLNSIGQTFVAAARRAVAVGFDPVEPRGAHGYLLGRHPREIESRAIRASLIPPSVIDANQCGQRNRWGQVGRTSGWDETLHDPHAR